MDAIEFCGRNNCLVETFNEISRASSGNEQEIFEAIDALLGESEDAYSSDRPVMIQAEVLANAVKAVLARRSEECERQLMRSSTEYFAEAIDKMAQVLPGLSATPLGNFPGYTDWEWQRLEQYASDGQKLAASVCLLDFMRELEGLSTDNTEYSEEHTVETPVLFTDGAPAYPSGFAGILKIELIRDGISCITPDLAAFGACRLHDESGHSLHESVLKMFKLSGLSGVRARWGVRPHDFMADSTSMWPRRQLNGRSLEAAMLSALWAANGGIPGDTYQAPAAWAMEPGIAVTGMVTEVKEDDQPGAFLIDAVRGVPEKLRAAQAARLYSVILAAPPKKPSTGVDEKQETWRREVDEAENQYRERERIRFVAAAQSASSQREGTVFDGSIVRVSTAREVFDSLLVTNRWLAGMQAKARENWLKNWECRPRDDQGNFIHGGARALGDAAAGPDDAHAPRTT